MMPAFKVNESINQASTNSRLIMSILVKSEEADVNRRIETPSPDCRQSRRKRRRVDAELEPATVQNTRGGQEKAEVAEECTIP